MAGRSQASFDAADQTIPGVVPAGAGARTTHDEQRRAGSSNIRHRVRRRREIERCRRMPGKFWIAGSIGRSWWHDWDKCVRIRHTVASMLLDRGIDALAFVRITGRDDVFAELIGALSEKFGSQRYLKAIRNRMGDAGIGGERLRMVKHAIMW